MQPRNVEVQEYEKVSQPRGKRLQTLEISEVACACLEVCSIEIS